MILLRLISKSLITLLLSASICFGADDSRLRVYPSQGAIRFHGLDERSSPTFIQDGYATTANDVVFSSTGGLRKRYGFSLVNNFDKAGVDYQALLGISYVKFSSGTENRIAIVGERFYYETAGAWTLIDNCGTYNQNNQFVFAIALDNVIFTNNVDIPMRWSGGSNYQYVSFTGLTNSIQKANAVAWFKNYLIFGNTTENSTAHKTRIRWSNVGTIGTWTDADFIDTDTLGGQEITGFAILYDNLFMFMTDSIYKISFVGGDDIFNISKVVEGTGAIAKSSIKNVQYGGQEGLMFLSKDKTINFFNGITPIEASFLIPTTMSGLNSARLQYAVAEENGDDYYLSVSNGTSSTNNLIIDINLLTGDISKDTQLYANAMGKIFDSNGNKQIYFGNYDSMLYRFNDSSKTNDVVGYTGVIDDVESNYTTESASGVQIIFDAANSFTATGALMRIIAGTGSGQERVITGIHTATGVVVDSAFTTTPDTTSQYTIGEINTDYITKWYDFGEPARRKNFGELYFWVEASSSSNIGVNYAQDFSAYIGSQSISLSGSGGAWGTAVWGTDVWGGEDALLKAVKLQGEGKFIRFRITEDDINETFNIYGMSCVFWVGDIL